MNRIPIKITPIESWLARKIGTDAQSLSIERIGAYQSAKLRETVGRARKACPFYRSLLREFPEEGIMTLSDLGKLPFTTADDLREGGLQFLCVSQSDIKRIVTLDSSGTTGNPKRIYFTPADQELTMDFFHHGMSTLVEEGDRVLILLPGEREGSVGDLLASALKRFGVIPVPHGVVRNIPETLKIMESGKISSIVGIPVQAIALARYAKSAGIRLRLKSVLLSTDYLPSVIRAELERMWGCEVFDHYGMTEMGLGGGVECGAHEGYHLREADIYFEIVDPETGDVLPAGETGEVVFTTLTRQGMPLIRYRTGDISRFLISRCGCGSVFPRLDKVRRRKADEVSIDGCKFAIGDLDEALFSADEVIDYGASVDDAGMATKLDISVLTVGANDTTMRKVSDLLDSVLPIQSARSSGKLKVSVKSAGCDGTLQPSRSKRVIRVRNGDI